MLPPRVRHLLRSGRLKGSGFKVQPGPPLTISQEGSPPCRRPGASSTRPGTRWSPCTPGCAAPRRAAGVCVRALAGASGSWLPTATHADALGDPAGSESEQRKVRGPVLQELRAARREGTTTGSPRGRVQRPGGRGPDAAPDGAAAQASPRTPPDAVAPHPARGHPRLWPLAAVCRPPRSSHPRLTPSGLLRPDLKIPGPTSENRRQSLGSAPGAEAVEGGVAAGRGGEGRGQRSSCSPRASVPRAPRLRASRGVPHRDQSAVARGGEGAEPRLESRGGACNRKRGLGVAGSLANRDEKSESWRVGFGAWKT